MPLPALAVAGLVAGGIGAAGKMFLGAKQNKLANKINPVYTPYQTSPYAKQQLGMAQQLFNGRMFGAAQQERNIGVNQANTIGQINRNATDGSQALALAAATQGTANQAYGQLGVQEAQNKYNLLDNLNDAQRTMIGEGDKIYQDQFQKFQIDAQQKNALRDSAYKNIWGGISDLGSMALQGATMGLGGLGQTGAGGAGNPMMAGVAGGSGFNRGIGMANPSAAAMNWRPRPLGGG